jgi:hypothetical protein
MPMAAEKAMTDEMSRKRRNRWRSPADNRGP